jgi:hypothetical protein
MKRVLTPAERRESAIIDRILTKAWKDAGGSRRSVDRRGDNRLAKSGAVPRAILFDEDAAALLAKNERQRDEHRRRLAKGVPEVDQTGRWVPPVAIDPDGRAVIAGRRLEPNQHPATRLHEMEEGRTARPSSPLDAFRRSLESALRNPKLPSFSHGVRD